MEKRRILRWRRCPLETGLRAVGFNNNTRGYELYYGDEKVGVASRLSSKEGFFWVACGKDFPYHNTCKEKPYPTIDKAKSAAEAHIRTQLGLPAKKVKAVRKDA